MASLRTNAVNGHLTFSSSLTTWEILGRGKGEVNGQWQGDEMSFQFGHGNADHPVPGMLVSCYYGQSEMLIDGGVRMRMGVIISVTVRPKHTKDDKWLCLTLWNFPCPLKDD